MKKLFHRLSLPGTIVLPLTIGLHLLVIHFLLSALRNVAAPSKTPSALSVSLAPSRSNEPAIGKAEPEDRPMPKPKTAVVPKRTTTEAAPPRPARKATDGPPSSPVMEEQASPPPSEPLPDVNRMLSNAVRDAGKIDREMRDAAPRFPVQQPADNRSAIEKSIAVAARPRSTSMETVTLSDGRKMTKVTGANGSYCVAADATSHDDYQQGGMRKRVTTCPD